MWNKGLASGVLLEKGKVLEKGLVLSNLSNKRPDVCPVGTCVSDPGAFFVLWVGGWLSSPLVWNKGLASGLWPTY